MTNRDEVLYVDPDGDAIIAGPPNSRGTLVHIKPGEGAVYLPTSVVDVLREALRQHGKGELA